MGIHSIKVIPVIDDRHVSIPFEPFCKNHLAPENGSDRFALISPYINSALKSEGFVITRLLDAETGYDFSCHRKNQAAFLK